MRTKGAARLAPRKSHARSDPEHARRAERDEVSVRRTERLDEEAPDDHDLEHLVLARGLLVQGVLRVAGRELERLRLAPE